MHNVIFLEDCFRWPSSGANTVAGRKEETVPFVFLSGKVERM